MEKAADRGGGGDDPAFSLIFQPDFHYTIVQIDMHPLSIEYFTLFG
jgi:hypothetical protein